MLFTVLFLQISFSKYLMCEGCAVLNLALKVAIDWTHINLFIDILLA